MIKVHYQDDQDALLEACGGQMNHLINTERGVKSAASELIGRDIIERFRPPDDHFLIHSIAMGDQETYGPNKNADGWLKQALQDRHHTFVTNGHFFREHRNRDPKQKIGDIKYAAYKSVKDGGMGRVELLKWGSKDKAAEEYELAKAGKELCFSMSARVPEDVCSCCKKRSKSASEYCDHLRHRALQYIPEFKKYAYAENPDPTFFDDSRVVRPADRIARFLEYKFPDSDMRKAASAQKQVIMGTEWAEFEGVMIPDTYVPDGLEGRFLRKLAAEEAWMPQAHEDYGMSKKATFACAYAPFALMHDATDAELDEFRRLRPGTLFRELAKRACVLSFPTFAAYATGRPIAEVKQDPAFLHAAVERMPEIFSKLASQGCEADIMSAFGAGSEFSAMCDPAGSDVVQKVMDEAERKFSIDSGNVEGRVTSLLDAKSDNRFKDMDEAEAGQLFDRTRVFDDVDGKSAALAESYAHYQLTALADIERLMGTGSVDDPEITLIAGSNRRLIYR